MTDDADILRRLAEERVGVPFPLHSYQWEGVSFLYRSSGALLADEMGLGKTVQASVAIALLLGTSEDVNRVLVVAPASLTLNWLDELSTWAPQVATRRLEGGVADRSALYALPIPLLVGSYEQIRMDGFDRIPQNTFDLVVLDEAQRIKNRDSATSLSCRLLSRTRSWALSATPLENEVGDVTAILGFLDPNFGPEQTRGEVVHKLKTSMLRRRKRNVRGDLPPVIVQDIRLDLGLQQRARYDELWATRRTHCRTRGRNDGVVAMRGMINRLKHICNQDEESGSSTKLDALKTILDSAGDSARVIVFSQFVRTLTWVAKRLQIRYDLLIGAMDMDERKAVMDEFEVGGSPRVLLASLRAAGVGLNLGRASHIVLFDRWWNPAVENQAVYRAHRFDRSGPLHVVRFVVRNSIEEHIASLLEKKSRLFENVVENRSTTEVGFRRAELVRILEMAAD